MPPSTATMYMDGFNPSCSRACSSTHCHSFRTIFCSPSSGHPSDRQRSFICIVATTRKPGKIQIITKIKWKINAIYYRLLHWPPPTSLAAKKSQMVPPNCIGCNSRFTSWPFSRPCSLLCCVRGKSRLPNMGMTIRRRRASSPRFWFLHGGSCLPGPEGSNPCTGLSSCCLRPRFIGSPWPHSSFAESNDPFTNEWTM